MFDFKFSMRQGKCIMTQIGFVQSGSNSLEELSNALSNMFCVWTHVVISGGWEELGHGSNRILAKTTFRKWNMEHETRNSRFMIRARLVSFLFVHTSFTISRIYGTLFQSKVFLWQYLLFNCMSFMLNLLSLDNNILVYLLSNSHTCFQRSQNS